MKHVHIYKKINNNNNNNIDIPHRAQDECCRSSWQTRTKVTITKCYIVPRTGPKYIRILMDEDI